MLEKSFGLNFFLKSQTGRSDIVRYVYVRVTVDGVLKDTSTKRKWDSTRWDQARERASGTREDAKSLNYFLDALTTNINNYKTELMNGGKTITAALLIDFVKGNNAGKAKVLEEFQKHNDNLYELVGKQYSEGTHKRFVTARSHVQDFIRFKYKTEDIEFRDLNYEFVKDYDFYLRTVRKCANNTTIKYIRNFKKIVLEAVAKDIIPKDPFIMFKGKIIKTKKKPLTKAELRILENKKIDNERLSNVRDIFVFQCYTGLAYIDSYQLKNQDIKEGDDGKLWIMSSRQKTDSATDIPLLPKALEIMKKYKSHPICIKRGTILPGISNQNMNMYLKEIAAICNLDTTLNTHKARRTFASTVALNNGVPITVVRDLMGHSSVRQTEEYTMNEQETISDEMTKLTQRLSQSVSTDKDLSIAELLQRLETGLTILKSGSPAKGNNISLKLMEFEKDLNTLKANLSPNR